MNTYDDLDGFDDLYRDGYGSHLFTDEERFECEPGLLAFDPHTLRTRVVDRPFDPFLRHLPRLRTLKADHGPGVLRRLAARLVRDSLPYAAVEALVEAAEDAWETGRASTHFDLLLGLHRDAIVSAGMFDWTADGVRRYAAPPLLAAATLLDDDPWLVVRTAYDLAGWMDNILSGGAWDRPHVSPGYVVEEFLAQHGI